MKKKIKLLLICFFIYPLLSFAQMTANQALRMEILQAQFSFDTATVSRASLVQKEGRFIGLHVKIKPTVAKVFEGLIKSNIGKTMNLVFNQKILTSSVINGELGNELLITGITKEDAELFIQLLRINDPPRNA